MNREFILAVEDLEREREISKDLLIEAIETALLSAYKKNYGTSQNVRVNIDRETGDIDVFMRRDVVGEVEDELTQIALEDVIKFDPGYQVGDAIEYRVVPKDFGRIAAQTAKQVVVQRIREAERGVIFDDYVNRQGEIVTGVIQRVVNSETVFVSMGKTEGIMAGAEQVRGERYQLNSRMKFYIMDVRKTMKGPQIYLSRSHPGLVKRLFELEVPEIEDGIVEIRGLAREAGSRTKVAVCTFDANVDPVGACVGARGSRVQAVVDELFGEKIDIINWSDNPEKNVSSALSPAKVEEVLFDADGKFAVVVVPDYQLSLAIGKEGQNVRLAAKLCGLKIDIRSHSQYFSDESEDEEENAAGDESGAAESAAMDALKPEDTNIGLAEDYAAEDESGAAEPAAMGVLEPEDTNIGLAEDYVAEDESGVAEPAATDALKPEDADIGLAEEDAAE